MVIINCYSLPGFKNKGNNYFLQAFGKGSCAQFTFGKQEYGDWNTLTWSWGIAVMMGIWVAGGISGKLLLANLGRRTNCNLINFPIQSFTNILLAC